MKLASGTPVVDGIGWIGAVMATIGDVVLVIELGAPDALNAAWYRTYKASALWLDDGIAYAVRGEMVDVGAVLRSWQRKQRPERKQFPFWSARRHAAPARPRAPMQAAVARQEAA